MGVSVVSANIRHRFSSVPNIGALSMGCACGAAAMLPLCWGESGAQVKTCPGSPNL